MATISEAPEPGRRPVARDLSVFKAMARKPDWRETERKRSEAAVEAVKAGHPEITKLRAVGEQLRLHYQTRSKQHAIVESDRSLSPEGKRARKTEIDQKADAALHSIMTHAAAIKNSIPVPAPAGLAMRPEDASRIAALAVILPSWPVEQVLDKLRTAVDQNDVATMRFLLPTIQERAETDPRYAKVRGAVAAIVADAEMRLIPPEVAGLKWAHDEAERIFGVLMGIIGTAETNGGRWDPVFDGTLLEGLKADGD